MSNVTPLKSASSATGAHLNSLHAKLNEAKAVLDLVMTLDHNDCTDELLRHSLGTAIHGVIQRIDEVSELADRIHGSGPPQ